MQRGTADGFDLGAILREPNHGDAGVNFSRKRSVSLENRMDQYAGRGQSEDDRPIGRTEEQPAINGEVEGARPAGAASAEEEIASLSELLGIALSTDRQLTGLTVGDVREATGALRDLVDEVRELRNALGPFAEIARRLRWDTYDRDSLEMGRHVIEAPAPDVDPMAAYCLTVGAFWRAAHLLDGDVDLDHPAGSTFVLQASKRWWRR
jgi:hypothetical protein